MFNDKLNELLTSFDLVIVNIPRSQGYDTCNGVDEAIIDTEKLLVAPRSILELVLHDPLQAGGKLWGVTSPQVLDHRHPRCIIGGHTYAPVSCRLQQRSNVFDRILNIVNLQENSN